VQGATDDFGFRAVQDRVHVHDRQATALHLLGLDYERLTSRHSGHDFWLTDVYGQWCVACSPERATGLPGPLLAGES
jgi:hypothetical protein